jgi:hypothetical protein
MTPSEVTRILEFAKGAYPRQTVSKETIAAYTTMLVDLDYEACKEALKRHCATSEWFPSIAALRGLAAQVGADPIPDQGAAWGEVMNAIRWVGYARTPTFSHPAVAAAVRAIGWFEICTTENLEATRAHWNQAYKGYRDREIEARVSEGLRVGSAPKRLASLQPAEEHLTLPEPRFEPPAPQAEAQAALRLVAAKLSGGAP